MKPKDGKNRLFPVSWMNSEQFDKVYNHLYSDSLTKKRWAVESVSVWNSRCYPALPTSVEVTASIVRAIIHDMLYEADKTFCQENDIQMLYSMALTRFVNLTLELHQNAASKIRMSVLAAKHNLPAWLIDLRNEAVHSYCPSLSILRFGAGIALQYLDETFWSRVAANRKLTFNLPSERGTEMVALINQYKNVQFQRFAEKIKTRDKSKDLKAVLKKISSCIFQDREKFIDILVQPGNFISIRDLRILLSEATYFLNDDSNINLPVTLQKFWLPILCNIHNNGLLAMFGEKLLLAQENCRMKICQRTAIAWAVQIYLGTESGALLAQRLKRRNFLLNELGLIYACVKGASLYSKELLNTIVANKTRQEKRKYGDLFFLLAVYQGHFLPKEDSSLKRKLCTDEDIIFAVEDVEEEVNELKAKKIRIEKDVNAWSSPSVTTDFSVTSIGLVLNPLIIDTGEDEQSSDYEMKEIEKIKIEPSVDDDFIIVNKNDGEGTVEEITQDINMFSVTTIPEDFDMIYRRRL